MGRRHQGIRRAGGLNRKRSECRAGGLELSKLIRRNPWFVARIERSEIRDCPINTASRPRVSLALNPGYSSTRVFDTLWRNPG